MTHRNICGPLIREARLAKGWTQEALAKRLQAAGFKLDAKAVSKVETQQRVVGDEDLYIIALAMDRTVNDLLPRGKVAQSN
jgi:transcriptional regulator with XRE-family HTH domain